MKVRILKVCSIKGIPARFGSVIEVTEDQGAVLVKHRYAQLAEPPAAPVPPKEGK